jgi:hypothetical protein
MTAASSGRRTLDGHLAVVLQVLGEIDGGHSAGTELALEEVAIGEGGGEAVGGGHLLASATAARAWLTQFGTTRRNAPLVSGGPWT